MGMIGEISRDCQQEKDHPCLPIAASEKCSLGYRRKRKY